MKKIYNFFNATQFSSIYFLCIILIFALRAQAQPVLSLSANLVTGLSAPMQLVNAGDGSNKIFMVEKGGTIKVFDNGFVPQGTFLTVTNVSSDGERGLLSMAFHPNYETNGFFYVFYTNNTPGAVGDLEIARYQVSGNPNIANAASKVIVITIPHQLAGNHNGGQLHFGPGGFLFLSTGDGGGGGDTQNNAQNSNVLLGKILRFNVNTSLTAPFYTIPPGNPFGNEVYALGLRNPYRWSFDRLTNDMWIGDVGQNSFEEINYRAFGTSLGVNYGWRCYEGDAPYNLSGCLPISNYTFPVYTYPTVSPKSITGGVVYRGTTYPLMYGWYIAADFYSGIFYRMNEKSLGVYNTYPQTLSPNGIVNFGETENGEVYVVSNFTGGVYQLMATTFLPLNLISFTGEKKEQGVQLSWTTSAEDNVKGFEIEYSLDGNNFNLLGIVPAGKIEEGGNYGYFHELKMNGDVFYRLKIVDNNGSTYSYSNVVRIKMNNGEVAKISPTLIKDGIINLELKDDADYHSLEIISVNGTVVQKEQMVGRNGRISIPVSGLSKGMYIVTLNGNSQKFVNKIMIQ